MACCPRNVRAGFPGGLRSQDGLLWFPTLKGIVVIDRIMPWHSPVPAVVLEQTLVDGVPKFPVLDRDDDTSTPARK